uniref:Uncharacterized protein n=1 Tax=Lactuca sativa TaxID=4236 RepID=A0A9R1W476_LACSA|nr:hypothetical protein LSAT_V11C300114630 [Lactuca sativa]
MKPDLFSMKYVLCGCASSVMWNSDMLAEYGLDQEVSFRSGSMDQIHEYGSGEEDSFRFVNRDQISDNTKFPTHLQHLRADYTVSRKGQTLILEFCRERILSSILFKYAYGKDKPFRCTY